MDAKVYAEGRCSPQLDPGCWLALPDDVFSLVFPHLTRKEMILLRLVAPTWRDLSSLFIKCLLAKDARLPPEAWARFPCATALVVSIANGQPIALSARLCKLVAELPARLQNLQVKKSTHFSWAPVTPEELEALGYMPNGLEEPLQQLAVHACARSLLSLTIGQHIRPSSAQLLLRSLPALQRCSLAVGGPVKPCPTPTLAHFPAGLQHFSLSGNGGSMAFSTGQPVGGPDVAIDLSSLAAACKRLHSLRLDMLPECLRNLQGLSACSALETLDLELHMVRTLPGSSSTVVQIITIAAALRRLRQLRLPDAYVSTGSEQWRQLAAMPALEQLELAGMDLNVAQPPAAQRVRRLTLQQLTRQNSLYRIWGKGSLGQMLPALERLRISKHTSDSANNIAWQLDGHAKLQELVLLTDQDDVEGWGWWLGTCPAMGKVQLHKYCSGTVDTLLQDAARCPQLRELLVQALPDCDDVAGNEEVQISKAGLQVLAAGPAARSLRRVRLDTMVAGTKGGREGREAWDYMTVALEDVAVLLRPGCLPLLEELELDVSYERATVAGQQQGVVAEAGAAAGARAGAQAAVRAAAAAGDASTASPVAAALPGPPAGAAGAAGAATTADIQAWLRLLAEAGIAGAAEAAPPAGSMAHNGCSSSIGGEGADDDDASQQEEGCAEASEEEPCDDEWDEQEVLREVQQVLAAQGVTGVRGLAVSEPTCGIDRLMCTPVEGWAGACRLRLRLWW
jgi:hypothetical protein